MFTLLDRQLVVNYVKAYLVCLASLMGLFVVVDLFTNLDDFTKDSKALMPVLEHIGIYYSYKIAQIFDRLSEATSLLGAMFTIAWVQRNNELVPILSAGVSTRRMVLPVLIGAVCVTGLAIANQEMILPHVDYYLLENRNDLDGKQSISVNGAREPNGTHITGQTAVRKTLTVKKFLCRIPKRQGSESIILQAEDARYIPAGDGKQSGGWLLTNTYPQELENLPRTSALEMIMPGKYFLRTQQVDFEAVTRQKNWWRFVSTLQLRDEMSKADSSNLANIAVVFHMRLTRPLLGIILVFLGLSIILRDQNRNVFISAGMTVFLGGVYFIVIFACKYLGDHGLLWPTLAAWMPVMIFGPMSLALFDAMHT